MIISFVRQYWIKYRTLHVYSEGFYITPVSRLPTPSTIKIHDLMLSLPQTHYYPQNTMSVRPSTSSPRESLTDSYPPMPESPRNWLFETIKITNRPKTPTINHPHLRVPVTTRNGSKGHRRVVRACISSDSLQTACCIDLDRDNWRTYQHPQFGTLPVVKTKQSKSLKTRILRFLEEDFERLSLNLRSKKQSQQPEPEQEREGSYFDSDDEE